MELTAKQLWERLRRTGLADEQLCQSWANDVEQSVGATNLQDAHKLAAELIRTKKILPSQWEILSSGVCPKLRFGAYEIQARLNPSSRSGRVDSTRWYSGVNLEDRKPKWFYAFSADELESKELWENPPSLKLIDQHLKLNSPLLDRWDSFFAEPGCFAAVAEPIKGESFSSRIAKSPLSVKDSLTIVRKVAQSLQLLHSNGLVHGCVCPGAVWLEQSETGGTSRLILRRDVYYPAASSLTNHSPSMLGVSDLERWASSAPELTLPDVLPSPSTDLYALGVLWCTLLIGKTPWEGAASFSRTEWGDVQRSTLPSLPDSLPEPIRRCILHLVAKNADNRFMSADAFLETLHGILGVAPAISLKTAPDISSNVQEDAPLVRQAPSTGAQSQQPQPELADLFQSTAPVQTRQKSSNSKVKRASAQRRPLMSWLRLPVPLPKWAWISAAAVGLLVVGAPVGYWWTRSGPISPTPGHVQNGAADGQNPTLSDIDGQGALAMAVSPEVEDRFQIRQDDGNLLWAPPSLGAPLRLDLLPAGMEAIAVFSPKLWSDHGSDQSADIEGLRSWFRAGLPQWKSFVDGLPDLESLPISQVTIALYPHVSSSTYEAVVRYRIDPPQTVESCMAHLPPATSQSNSEDAMKGIYVGETASFAFSELQLSLDAQIDTIVIGSSQAIASLKESVGQPMPVRRQMEMLLRSSHSESDLFVAATPAFLLGGGSQILEAAPALKDALSGMLNDRVQAVSFAGVLAPEAYAEFRLVPSDATQLQRFRVDLKDRLDRLPDIVEKQFVSAPPPAYWRAVANRFPQMLRSLNVYTRWGVEEGQLVANGYLPASSVQNVVIGAWMSLQDQDAISNSGAPEAGAVVSLTIDELLDKPITIGFAQETLEMGLASITSEVNESILKDATPIIIAINGSAFQAEGITQNQTIREFKQSDAPLRQVLTDLVRRANPVTTVQSATEVDQKVVWVIIPDERSFGSNRIELTTRSWAQTNQAILPEEFLTPESQ